MNVFRFVLKTATILLLVIPNQAPARITQQLSYQEMLAKSNLVAIEAQVSRALDGPFLVRFDPSVISKRGSYVLFLVRKPDGRFAAIGGQTDPGMKAISPIPFELH